MNETLMNEIIRREKFETRKALRIQFSATHFSTESRINLRGKTRYLCLSSRLAEQRVEHEVGVERNKLRPSESFEKAQFKYISLCDGSSVMSSGKVVQPTSLEHGIFNLLLAISAEGIEFNHPTLHLKLYTAT